MIYLWDGNLFRFIVKHIHASQVGRTENCNMLIAHVQYIGPDSMASRYAYQVWSVKPSCQLEAMSWTRSNKNVFSVDLRYAEF